MEEKIYIFNQIVLASRPKKKVSLENFRLEKKIIDQIYDGQILIKNHYLSLDPYMRLRMMEKKSYAQPQLIDEVMIGGTVGEVIISRHEDFKKGDMVVGMLGWSEMAISDGNFLRKIYINEIPLSAYLGVIGMPGITAWYGLTKILSPRARETLVVTSASGAVGSIVGQLAKIKGCKVIGIAGSDEKCEYIKKTLNFDISINYKKDDLNKAILDSAPEGIDCLFENVGGQIFDTLLKNMKPYGRIAICGLISEYDNDIQPIYNLRNVLTMKLSIQGFIITDHMKVWGEGINILTNHILCKNLKYKETVINGLNNAPEAFIGLLYGKNFGKQLVKLI